VVRGVRGDAAGRLTPFADVEETDDAYLVDVELPGVKKKDISIEILNGRDATEPTVSFHQVGQGVVIEPVGGLCGRDGLGSAASVAHLSPALLGSACKRRHR
jgi:hypothetical protein